MHAQYYRQEITLPKRFTFRNRKKKKIEVRKYEEQQMCTSSKKYMSLKAPLVK